jgi:hypothetical protein
MPETKSRVPFEGVHLDTLTYLIETGKCALVLGPQLSSITENGRNIPLRHRLARELAEELAKTPGMAIPDPDDLALVASTYQKHFNGSRLTLEHKVGSFYRRYNDPGDVLRSIAHLPFRIILSTAQDNLLQSAFKKEGKLWQEGHYRMGETQADNYDESSSLPYIYQLFGKVLDKDVDRLVLTQQDQLRYIDSMQGVGRETRLPPALLRAMQDCKGFLFLGFDFEDWYLRVLLHILHFSRDEQAVFGQHLSQPDRPLPASVGMYFSNQYQITFLPETDPLDLVSCLRDRFNNDFAETPGEQPALQLLYLHAIADNDTRIALDKAISRLKSVHNIASSSIHELLAGTDIAAARRKMVEEANLIIAILSADYTADDWLINELTPLASTRHGSERTRMTAVYAREAFGVTDEFLRLGIPVLPAGDIPVSDMNPDKAYQKIAEALQKILEGML